MTSVSADGSGDDGKRWMESSQRHGSSDLDYSEDTFEPFSEEEESCWQRGSEPWESEGLEGSAASDTSGSTSWLAGQNDGDERSEGVDSAAVERVVLRKWIGLQNKEAGTKQDKSAVKTQAETREFLDAERDALRSFCTVKISKMRQQPLSEQPNGGKSRKLQPGLAAEKPQTSGFDCPVPDGLMNRIRLKNVRETVKQVTEAQIHESSVCPDCQKKEAELARITFLRRKKTLMESALIQEKLEEQIYSTDVLMLIGEALRSFPKPSEDPGNLWQRLKGQNMYGLKVVNITQGHKELGESPAGSDMLNANDGGCNLVWQ